MPDRDWVIIVQDTELSDFDDIQTELERLGFKTSRSFKELGTLFGQATDDKVDAFSRVRGVMSVESENHVQLPPIDEDIPQ